MKKQQFRRLLSLALAIVMCLGLALPASAGQTPDGDGIIIEKVDNSAVSVDLRDQNKVTDIAANTPHYADTDMVRVSIVLEEKPTLEIAQLYGVSTKEIASSSAVMNYRQTLKENQVDMAAMISNRVLGGEELDVVWNLTLVTNIISANVQYGKIDAIRNLAGVKDVVLEICYEPAVVTKGGDDPNMATSSEQIGSTTAYLEGYYGAGSRIAVIDTGTDTDHQSFDNGAFLYALEQNAEEAGMTYDEYVASLDLLDAAEIASVFSELNIVAAYQGLTANMLYVNEKLPYGFNYVDDGLNITHDRDQQGEHGSHVAGIATANRYIPDGEGGYEEALESVCVQGVAPDAQLITMKVFGAKGGAYDADYMAAIEDAIVLGCDAVNLSLGSGNPGFTTSTYQDIMDELANTDTVVVMSAGNSYSWVEEGYLWKDGLGYWSGGYLYYDDVSMHSGGSPGTFTNSLGVASVENSGFTTLYVEVGGEKVFYAESLDYSNAAMTTLAGEQEYVFVNGIGTAEDFAGVDVAGKIALCYRGTTSFYEKANAAMAAGAIGVIIVNNQPGVIYLNLTDYEYTAPVVSITQADGELFKTNPATGDSGSVLYWTGTMDVAVTPATGQYNSDYYTMSDFSSWGVPGDLSMKPEITAPGGSIYSVFGSTPANTATDQYELMSGTSMAAPQITGMVALLMQYIRDNDLSVDGMTDRALAQSLLMSTAEPLYEEDSGEYYSILKQGAGLANIGAAIQANSYIKMGDDATDSAADGKVKVELGDDAGKTGEYSFTFSINNLTGKEQRYTLDADFFTQDLFAYGGYAFMDTWTTPLNANVSYTVDGVPMVGDPGLLAMDFDGDNDVDLDDGQALLDYATGKITTLSNSIEANLDEDGDIDSYDAYLFFTRMGEGEVSVPANESVTITVDVELDDAELLSIYPNGAYVEGYVYVRNMATEEGVAGETHSIPVLGFYGNWTDASMYDVGSYWEYVYGLESDPSYLYDEHGGMTNFMTVKYAGESGEYFFSGNPYVEDSFYMPERAALNNQNGDMLNKLYFTAIRNAGNAAIVISDANTGEIYVDRELGQVYGAYYYVNGDAWRNYQYGQALNWDGTDDAGDKLNENTTVNVSLILAPELYDNGDGTYDWDALGEGAYLTTQVTIDNTAPELVDDEVYSISGDTMSITVRDNQYVAAVALYDEFGQHLYTYAGSDAGAEPRRAITYELDLSGVDGACFLLQVYDYAGNTTTYKITRAIGETTESINHVEIASGNETSDDVFEPNTDAVKMFVGHTLQLNAFVDPVYAVERDVEWSSVYPEVATVDQNGLVTAVDEGVALIVATSTADSTKYDVCQITVNSAAYTATGVLLDEDGDPMSFTWNFETDSTWSKLADLSVPVGSAADAGNGNVYIISSDTGAPYEVNLTTGSVVASGASQTVPYWDFAVSKVFTNGGNNLATYVYGPYFILMQDPMAPQVYGANLSSYLSYYTGASCLVAIESAGYYYDSARSSHAELYFALDDAGYIWVLEYTQAGDVMLFGLYPTTLDVSFVLDYNFAYCNLVGADDGTLFLSHFNGDTNDIYMLTPVLNGGGAMTGFDAVKMGDVGDGVWPAIVTSVTANTPVSSLSGASVNAMVPSAQLQSVEVEMTEISAIRTAPAGGSLNAVVSYTAPIAPMSTGSVADDEGTVEVVVTAKDANGVDIASTNGVITITYDADSLTLDTVVVNGNYRSVVYDDANGTVTIGYVSLVGIDAGGTVAVLSFTVDETTDSEISILHEEAGDANPDYTETIEVSYDHIYGEWYEYVPATCDAPGEERRDCDHCDKYESRVTLPLGHDYGEWYVFKEATTTEAGEERRDCANGDHYESKLIAVLPAPDPVIPTPTPVPTPDQPSGGDSGSGGGFSTLPFLDVDSKNPYYDSIEYVYDNGLMVGISGTLFDPNGTLNRAMVVTTLYRLEKSPEVEFTGAFSDVKDGLWYSDAVEWAAENGVVLGYPDGSFGPMIPVTNEQLAAILYRYAELKGYDLSGTVDLTQYADGAKISSYAVPAMIWSLNKDLMVVQNGMLFARQDATRAQVAYALHHFIVNVMGE